MTKNKEIKIDLEKVFNDEWLTNVYNAALVAMDHTKNKDGNVEETARSVIDYNIEKRLEETILTELKKSLPKSINWKNKNLVEAFDEFKQILDICDVVDFKKLNIKINIGDSKITEQNLQHWKNIANIDYPNLELSTTKLENKNNIYKVEITKLK